jgi:hypothetical protein
MGFRFCGLRVPQAEAVVVVVSAGRVEFFVDDFFVAISLEMGFRYGGLQQAEAEAVVVVMAGPVEFLVARNHLDSANSIEIPRLLSYQFDPVRAFLVDAICGRAVQILPDLQAPDISGGHCNDHVGVESRLAVVHDLQSRYVPVPLAMESQPHSIIGYVPG